MSNTHYRRPANLEQDGAYRGAEKFRFVVQIHKATQLHFDFRLELGGVLKSWAIPKGPSLNPKHKRLAIMVDDHPVDYINYQGIIPEGSYGAGVVSIWDKGFYIPLDEYYHPISENETLLALQNGELRFILKGEKLKGEFVLIKINGSHSKKNKWLLIKHKDKYAVNELCYFNN